MDQSVISRITGIISSYVYSDLDNLLGTSKLIFEQRSKRLVLAGYIPEGYVRRDKQGTCLKLTKLALDDIKEIFGESLAIRSVTGHEPRFFNDKCQGLHNYLILGSEEDSLVVDPSFKHVGPLKDSGYLPIEDLLDFSLLYDRDLYLAQDDAVPLLLNTGGNLVRLGFKLKDNSFRLIVYTTTKDGKSHTNYQYGKNIATGQGIPDIGEPQHALEEKVRDLVINSSVI